MILEKYSAPTIKTMLVRMEKNIVTQNPVPRKRRYFFLDLEYSDIYFVIPALMPPLEIPSVIVEKLFSCPSSAIPAGPIIAATTLTLTNPVSILMTVETAFRDDTLNRSVDKTFLILTITFEL